MDQVGMLFDGIADVYDRVRPRYPAELFADLATHVPGVADVLEVGCGTGQATGGLLDLGWRVHAVEPGAGMAARARDNLAGRAFTVDVAAFEDWTGGRAYDLLFSATAFHWVAAAVRWRRAFDALRPGAPIAFATNRTVAGGGFHELYRATEDLHRRLAPEVEFGLAPHADELTEQIRAGDHDLGAVLEVAEPKAGHSRAGDLFEPPELRFYRWTQTYDADDAAALLSTYSIYLRVPEKRRTLLLREIADVVRAEFGGAVSREYLAVLAVAVARGQDRES